MIVLRFIFGFAALVAFWSRFAFWLVIGGCVQAQYWVRGYKYWGGKWVKRRDIR